MKKTSITICLAFLLSCMFFSIRAQDIIIKINRDSISVKLIEVGLNSVSYKRSSTPNGPVFVLDKTEISLIKYANGEVEHFNQTPGAKNTSTTSATSNTTASNGEQQVQGKNKIEFINDQYLINGQKAKRKDVNRYLEKSKNPAILLGLKATKATTTAQKIVKITSIPTTIAGSITTLFTVVEGYQLVQRGRATTRTFVNMGLSFVGTISLPITNKILKKKSDKMYDKLIDMYNLTN